MNTERCCVCGISDEDLPFFINPTEKREWYPENRNPAAIEALYTAPSLTESEYALNTTAWD